MTRPLQEIEADLDVARASHQAANVSWQEAVKAHHDLRGRVIAGDETVTAADLAKAEHEAEHRFLSIPAKLAAIQALEAELLVATTELWADEVAATEPALRGDVEHAFKALDAVLDHLVTAWRLHATFVSQTAMAVGSTVSADVTSKVKRGVHGVVVDGITIRPIPVHEPLQRSTERAHQRLFAGSPKAQV
jgi:hypothetical protein